MRNDVSNTAEFGDLTRGPRVIDDGVRERMQRTSQRGAERGICARMGTGKSGESTRVTSPPSPRVGAAN